MVKEYGQKKSMDTSMRESGRTTKDMVMEYTHGQMDLIMMDSSKNTR